LSRSQNQPRYSKKKNDQPQGLAVTVVDGNVEKAIRKQKKKLQQDGKLLEYKARQEFVKPSMKRKLAKAAAKRRLKKQLASQQENEFRTKRR